ncbi:MAG: hypothetical protein HY074_12715 [Deltaproteobacteria bacterium]|nr:hypothetical protein [Deltaproteobacteria bacterium]
MNSPSPASVQAMYLLRDSTHFQWALVPIFAVIAYLYCQEISARKWNVVIAGLAFYGIEWLGEVVNALVLHFSGYAALWAEPGPTAYLVLVGLNIETSLMFLVFGLAVAKLLPARPEKKIFGVPNRLLVILGFSLFSVAVETVLNAWGALTWDYRWWGWPNIWSVILVAYAPAIAFTIWVHDLKSVRHKLWVLGGIYLLDALCLVLFIGVLKWI